MIYITGDTHGEIDVWKLSRKHFNYKAKNLTKKDYLIICGDFGFIWTGTKKDDWWLKWLNNLPCTILWCDGNHENFDAIYDYPVEEWNGGKIHRIRENVIHLMRGQVFTIDGEKIFVMGGATSVDKMYRKEHVSWWPQEMPSDEEFDEGLKNLEANNWEVDYVITHCASDNIQYRINSYFEHDKLTNYLFVIDKDLKFKHWYFGHYHIDNNIDDCHTALYNQIIPIGGTVHAD